MVVRRRRRGSAWRWVLAVVIAAAVGAYFLLPPSAPPPPVPIAASGGGVTPNPRPTLPREASHEPPELPLPPLAESDPAVRDLAGGLSSRPDVAHWLSERSLVQRLVAVVDDIAEGATPRPLLLSMAPAGAFATVTRGERVYVDPQSYARYDDVADAFTSLDADRCAQVYVRLTPLIDEAYRDLGRPERRFGDALGRAIARLLATPVVEGDVELRPLVTTYAFARPDLEALSPAQKQLLRMGPRNVRAIQTHLRAIAAALGIPETQLPAASGE